jgi:hypothetical protein
MDIDGRDIGDSRIMYKGGGMLHEERGEKISCKRVHMEGSGEESWE